MLFRAWVQDRDNTLLLIKLLKFGNFGGAICLDLGNQLKNTILKRLVKVTKLIFRLFRLILYFYGELALASVNEKFVSLD